MTPCKVNGTNDRAGTRSKKICACWMVRLKENGRQKAVSMESPQKWLDLWQRPTKHTEKSHCEMWIWKLVCWIWCGWKDDEPGPSQEMEPARSLLQSRKAWTSAVFSFPTLGEVILWENAFTSLRLCIFNFHLFFCVRQLLNSVTDTVSLSCWLVPLFLGLYWGGASQGGGTGTVELLTSWSWEALGM